MKQKINMKKKTDTYVYDLDAIMNYVFTDDGKRNNDSEITETYIADESSGQLSLVNKQLREVKGSDNSNKNTIRYDLMKFFMDQLNNFVANDDVQSTIGEAMILNTMLHNGFVKIVE